ncbi:hypothetical protein RhiirA1_471758 [Rhizophagus irregularis]|uniref:Uncharacterized protein n=1 Tax=Rhizophagus irregularis TaxID=588596 RepID=A0A2N0R3N3_9GLOM|nr:hypothetical protein RhiirA1_471758 [Rhizophagus irregularis]
MIKYFDILHQKSDIYSFSVIIAELSSGKPPLSLALAICNGLKPEFGEGTLNLSCKNEIEESGYKGKEIKAAFKEADKENTQYLNF